MDIQKKMTMLKRRINHAKKKGTGFDYNPQNDDVFNVMNGFKTMPFKVDTMTEKAEKRLDLLKNKKDVEKK